MTLEIEPGRHHVIAIADIERVDASRAGSRVAAMTYVDPPVTGRRGRG